MGRWGVLVPTATVLTVEQLQAHVKRLTYRPDWTFEVYEGEFEGPHIFIVATVQDSYRDGKLELGVRSAIPPMESTEQFERWLLWRLIRIECHEAREFFKRDGQIISDPHAEDQ